MNKARREQLRQVISDLTDIKRRVSEIRDKEESAFDNMPENLQDSFRGSNSQDAIGSLESAEESLDEALDSLEEATY